MFSKFRKSLQLSAFTLYFRRKCNFSSVRSVFECSEQKFKIFSKKLCLVKGKNSEGQKKRKMKHRRDEQDEHKISRLDIMCNLTAEESIWIPNMKPSPWRLEIDKPRGKMALNVRRPKQSLLILWVWEFLWRVCGVRHASWPHTFCLKGKQSKKKTNKKLHEGNAAAAVTWTHSSTQSLINQRAGQQLVGPGHVRKTTEQLL